MSSIKMLRLNLNEVDYKKRMKKITGCLTYIIKRTAFSDISARGDMRAQKHMLEQPNGILCKV